MSCVIIYMVIFPYIQYAPDMLKERFGFDKGAGAIYALPYIISGIMSPILGIIIDKIGKRALFSKLTTHIALSIDPNCLFFAISHDIISFDPACLHCHDLDPSPRSARR